MANRLARELRNRMVAVFLGRQDVHKSGEEDDEECGWVKV
jgi:hypothetical protein